MPDNNMQPNGLSEQQGEDLFIMTKISNAATALAVAASVSGLTLEEITPMVVGMARQKLKLPEPKGSHIIG